MFTRQRVSGCPQTSDAISVGRSRVEQCFQHKLGFVVPCKMYPDNFQHGGMYLKLMISVTFRHVESK